MFSLELAGPRTPLYPLIKQKVTDEAYPIFERLQAWRMMTSGPGLNTTNIQGKPIRYSGSIGFEGSPRIVFWSGLFEPFLSKAAQQCLQWTIDTCRERHLSSAEYLAETRDLLGVLVQRVYEHMARTDQVLRGRGFPKTVTPVNVAPKIDAMKRHIDDMLTALTHGGPPPTPPVEKKEILLLKPSLWGMGVDLKALGRTLWRRWFMRTR